MSSAAPALRFGYDVDQSVRDALAADPNFVHPDYREHPAFVIRDGQPRRARIVGVVRRPVSWTALAYAVLADGESVVIVMNAALVSWSADEAAAAQAEIDTAFDL